MIDFWELPGPQRFVTDIVDDLREGRNVFIILPDNLPKRFFQTIQNKASSDELPFIERILISTNSQNSPEYDLQKSLNFETQKEFNTENVNLYENQSFKGRILWIENLWEIGENANLWFKFFKQYSFICGNYDLVDRTLFIVPIKEKLIDQKIPTENLFTQHWYWDKLSNIDVQIYTAQLINEIIFEPLENQLAVNVITSVCGFEIECIEKLCEEWLSNNEKIFEILIRIGKDRNWNNFDKQSIIDGIEKQNYSQKHITDRPPSYLKKIWGKGMLNLISGRIFISPILLGTFGNNTEELRHRIWRGHAQTLLPIIDEYRIKIIEILNEYGVINFENDRGDDSILEIGRIKYKIDTNRKLRRKIDKDLLDLIRLLTKLRNSIAHLKIIHQARRQKLIRLIETIF